MPNPLLLASVKNGGITARRLQLVLVLAPQKQQSLTRLCRTLPVNPIDHAASLRRGMIMVKQWQLIAKKLLLK
ncbi:MAG: hypothetical protein CK424_00400 [Legionella sp.]|nr:MAG: hypothetical protein CK424_00400 [Legionella sp.]